MFTSLNEIFGTVDLSQTTLESLKNLLDSKITEYNENIYNISTGLIETTNMVDEVSTGLNAILSLGRDSSNAYHPELRAEKYSLTNKSGEILSYVSLDDTNSSPDFWFREQSGGNARVHVGNLIIQRGGDERDVDVSVKLYEIDASIATKASNASLSELQTLANGINASVNTVATNLVDISTAVKRNTIFVDNVSYNNGFGIKADELKVGNSLLLSQKSGSNVGDVLSISGTSGLAEVDVNDVNFSVNNTPYKLSGFYSNYDILKTDFNTLKNDFEEVERNLKSITEDGDNIRVHSTAKIDGTLTVEGNATFQSNINLGGDTFKPLDSAGGMVNAEFKALFVGNDKTNVMDAIGQLSGMQETVDDVADKVKSLTGGDSGEESID